MKEQKPVLVTQSALPPFEEYCEKIKSIWETHWLTNNGALHNELQMKLQEYLSVKNVTLFTNGHLALDVAIKALKLKGEVITTPFTFASTTHAIVMNGCKPVFCDIKLSDYTIDEEKIERLITPKTCAIVAVHVYGYPCNVSKIEEIAKRHNLKVIYDAAHVFGVKINGAGIGSFGNVSMMSFHATKVFHTIEGGALLYNNNEYRRSFDLYKNFGITGPETVEAVGLNAKMNEFQAAMGLLNLKYVDEQIAHRKNITNAYRNALKDVKGIYFVDDVPGVQHNYAYLPILVKENEYGKNRDELFEELGKNDIYSRKYFYPIVPEYECYKQEYGDSDVPNAKYAGDRVLTLPMYGSLSLDIVENICSIIKAFGK